MRSSSLKTLLKCLQMKRGSHNVRFYFTSLHRTNPLGYKLCMLRHVLKLEFEDYRHVIQTSYKPLESAIYIDNDYAS